MKIFPEKINKSAFTLMELLIATAVLALALGGSLALFIANLRLIESGKNLSIAINHARCVMEQIRDRNLSTLVLGEDWTAWAQAEPPYGGGCNSLNGEKINVTYPSGTTTAPLEIVVTVCWREKDKRIIGEDTNLNGDMDAGEDVNENGRLDSPAQLVTLFTER